MTFYSKLTKELKKQFKTSDISIPKTRAKCVAVAQRVWKGLHGFDDKRGSQKNLREKDSPTTSFKYSHTNLKRD